MSPTDSGTQPPGGPVRLLFQVHNRRGLGHLVRGLNVARAIRSLAPDTEIHFYTRRPPPEGLWDPAFSFSVEKEPKAFTHWPERVAELAPRCLIYDTMLPPAAAREPELPDTRRVLMMRRCTEERQQKLLANPYLERIDRIVVPHEANDFGHDLPPALADRCCFVGPIVRSPDSEVQQKLHERYRIPPGGFVVVSTVGGGGFREHAQAFFETVLLAHEQLRSVRPDLVHIVVQGPNFAGNLPARSGLTVVASEPQLVNLLALADLAIAEGGYNTVNEIRVTRTPAVFLPSSRSNDDQEERVRRLEAAGLARVLSGSSPVQMAQAIAELCRAPEHLHAMRERYSDHPLVPGNRTAAQAILDLCAD